jgi:hypothetical protein
MCRLQRARVIDHKLTRGLQEPHPAPSSTPLDNYAMLTLINDTSDICASKSFYEETGNIKLIKLVVLCN